MRENKEYTIIGKKVKVRDQNGQLHTREYQPNMGEILCIENRKEVLEEALRQEEIILDGLTQDINTSFVLKRYPLRVRKCGSEAVIKLLHRELSVAETFLKGLQNHSLEDQDVVFMDTVEVSEDQDYMFDLVSRIDMISVLGEKRKKLLKMNEKGTLDYYLDRIGCREEDKSIYKELLEIPDHTNHPVITKKK